MEIRCVLLALMEIRTIKLALVSRGAACELLSTSPYRCFTEASLVKADRNNFDYILVDYACECVHMCIQGGVT